MSKATDEAMREAGLAQGRADDAEARSRTIAGRMQVRQDLAMERETVLPGTIASGTTAPAERIER